MRNVRVHVEGTPYEPTGAAIGGRHLHVSRMTPVQRDADLVFEEIGGEERLTGRFEEYTFPEGTKLAGEKWDRFVDEGGTAFFLSSDRSAPPGETVTILAHRVEPSRFIARPGGPYLWVLEIEGR